MQEMFFKNGKKSMKYSVKLTEEFLEEIEKICEYISDKLKNIDASNRLREKVMYNVLLLEDSPKMFVEIEKTDKTKRAYRKIIVDNYTVLYTIDEENKIAYIAHIYYRRQKLHILKRGKTLFLYCIFSVVPSVNNTFYTLWPAIS